MRTLSRPMFNMGGPIKEGVMHGIREPYKGGTQAALVGNPIFPKDKTGRAHHAAFFGIPAALSWAGRAAPWAMRGIKSGWSKFKPTFTQQPGVVTGGQAGTAGKYISQTMPPVSKLSKIKAFAKENPWWTYGGIPYAAITDPGQAVMKGAPKVLGGGLKWGAEALTPGSLEKYLPWEVPGVKSAYQPPWADSTETTELIEDNVITKAPGVPGGGDKRMTYTDPDKANKLAKADKDKRVNNLLEIMGYDKSKKDAAYDALIDASQIISQAPGGESLDISRDIIQPAIGAASKRFDKPKEIREAVGLLMAKGEVEKDIAQAKGTSSEQAIDALATASGRTKKYVANAKLGIPNTVAEAKSQLVKLKKGPVTSDDVTTVAMSFAEENGIPFKQQFTTEQKNEVVGKGKKYPSVLEMINAMKLDPNGADDGLYVVGTSIVEVEKGTPKLKG